MAEPDHTSFSKRDVERLVRELVPPIATETAKAVAAETARAVASEIGKTLAGEVSKGVAQALMVVGIEPTTAAGIAVQHRRNQHLDEWIAGKRVVEDRWNAIDDLLKDVTPEDRAFLRDQRRKAELDARTFREAVIRYVVPLILGAIVASVGFWMFEKRSSAPVTFEHRRAVGAPVNVVEPVR